MPHLFLTVALEGSPYALDSNVFCVHELVISRSDTWRERACVGRTGPVCAESVRCGTPQLESDVECEGSGHLWHYATQKPIEMIPCIRCQRREREGLEKKHILALTRERI